jgi:hypothetical protein
MKKLGLIIALLGLASGAVYAGTLLWNTKSKNTINKGSENWPADKEADKEEIQSSISKGVFYVDY